MVLVLLHVWCREVQAQSFGDKTTLGKEFWLAFLQNWTFSEQYLYVSGKPGTPIEISQPSNGKRSWHGKFKLNSKGVYLLDLSGFQTETMHTETERSGKGIKITAEDSVAVYVANVGSVSSDAAIILPVESLGREYYVLTYISRNTSGSSQFAVLAVEDNTEVEIVSTAQDTKGWLLPGVPRKFTFAKAGEMIQFKGTDGGGVDFSGTRVRALTGSSKQCKKIAVFGSANYTMICTDSEFNNSVLERGKVNVVSDDPGCDGGRDHQIEQMHPVESWGRRFIVTPFMRRSYDIYRVIASEDSTVFYVNDLSKKRPYRNKKGEVIVLNKGDWFTFMLPNIGSDGKPKASIIESDRPIAVGHYAASKHATLANPGQYGDPFFILESPTEQFLTDISFNVFEGIGSGFVYYLNVFLPTAGVGRLKFDGKIVPTDQFIRVSDAPQYSFWRLENITPGNHQLSCPEGFVGYVYGYSRDYESYGYLTGAKLNPINLKPGFIDKNTGKVFQDKIDPVTKQVIEPAQNQICTGIDVLYTMTDLNARFRYFQWSFPDETTGYYDPKKRIPNSDTIKARALRKIPIELYDGDTVQYRFTKNGVYRIKVFAFRDSLDFIDIDNPNKCNKPVEYEILLDLKQDPYAGGRILGPNTVCPSQKNVEYKLTNNSGYPRYIWSVVGGTITKYDTLNNIIWVDWNDKPQNSPFHARNNKNGTGVFVQGIDSIGCISDKFAQPVSISPIPPAPSVTGPICASFDEPTVYEIKGASGGGVTYAWKVAPNDGNFSFSYIRPDSSMISIIWKPEAAGKKYKFSARKYVPLCGFSEYSSPDSLVVTVFPSLAGSIVATAVSYPPANTSSSEEVPTFVYTVTEQQPFLTADSFAVYRKTFSASGTLLARDTLIGKGSGSPMTFTDRKVKPSEEIYEYTVRGKDNCGRPLASAPLRTILLSATKREEQINPAEVKEFTKLEWSDYISWPGRIEYQIHRSVNHGKYEPYPSAGVMSTSGVEFETGKDGLFQSYQIEARLINTQGDYVRSVWSNTARVEFPKNIFGTVLMSPNGDGKNDVLYIVNMESHPVLGPKRLVIYNRWGQTVKTIEDYKQDWDGTAQNGEKLEGTYYYVVLDTEGGLVTKGAVTILR